MNKLIVENVDELSDLIIHEDTDLFINLKDSNGYVNINVMSNTCLYVLELGNNTKNKKPRGFFMGAKRETITGVIKGIDSINNTVDTAMNFGARGYLKTTNELIEKVNLITVEDIKRVANTLVLDTTYFMRGNK